MALKEVYDPNSNVNNTEENKSKNTKNKLNLKQRESGSRLNPEGPGYVLTVPSEETCQGSREGIATHAVVAICARDMSAVISDHPP